MFIKVLYIFMLLEERINLKTDLFYTKQVTRKDIKCSWSKPPKTLNIIWVKFTQTLEENEF